MRPALPDLSFCSPLCSKTFSLKNPRFQIIADDFLPQFRLISATRGGICDKTNTPRNIAHLTLF
jgi:hypothetical protein